MDGLILEQAKKLAKSIAGEVKIIEDLKGVLGSLMKSVL